MCPMRYESERKSTYEKVHELMNVINNSLKDALTSPSHSLTHHNVCHIYCMTLKRCVVHFNDFSPILQRGAQLRENFFF
jgi:hypothetical protein